MMKNIIKKYSKRVPRPIRVFLYMVYENFFTALETIKYPTFLKTFFFRPQKHTGKQRILFYHVSGLSFGGTEKFLQIIAKHIDKEKYDVFFMYSAKPRKLGGGASDGRLPYLQNNGITLIPFDYQNLSPKYPFVINGMQPDFFDILREKKIDMVFTAGSGYSEFPFNLIRRLPIVLINIFASPSAQSNIKTHLCISQEVARKIAPVVPEEKRKVVYIQSEGPLKDSERSARVLRERFGIADAEIVFGRIGRADNGIFDPIGIRAFQKIVPRNPHAHYLIMSAPPILKEIVEKEKIPNVHFLEPSAREEDVWAFHQAIDCVAHFRYDGESCGLNIAESMLCGKPVITHRSPIWNAHLEYLDPSFARIADMNDSAAYAEFMQEMIAAKESGKLAEMGRLAQAKAEPLFLIKNNIGAIEHSINAALQ